MNPSLHQPIGAALNPRRSRAVPVLVLIITVLAALATAAYGYIEQRRTERVLVVVRPVAYGQQIRADDLGTIEVAYHRPAQLTGVADPQQVIGKYAARAWTPNDLVQPAMLLDRKPTVPVYPSGEQLAPGMVATSFSTVGVGPLSADDTLNIGFLDPTGDVDRCVVAGGQAVVMPVAPSARAADDAPSGVGAPVDATGTLEPYACRLLSNTDVLYVDDQKEVAYLALTPPQALALRSLQAAQLLVWGERYGTESPMLPPLDRLDPAQISPALLTAPVSDTVGLPPTDSPMTPQSMSPGAFPPPATSQPLSSAASPAPADGAEQ